MWTVALSLGLSLPTAGTSLAQNAEDQIPFSSEGTKDLRFPAHPHLDLTGEGTLEFHVAATWETELPYYPCILATAKSEQETRYAVHIGPGGTTIGMWNGTAWAELEHSFEIAKNYHVALVTNGNSTEVFIDGVSIGKMALGYGTTTGAPLIVGSSGTQDQCFVGQVAKVRIWNKALSAHDLSQVAERWGPSLRAEEDGVEKSARMAMLMGHVVAYSDFTPTAMKFTVVDHESTEAPGPTRTGAESAATPMPTLTGLWKDPSGQEIEIAHDGTTVIATMKTEAGRRWWTVGEGTLRQSSLTMIHKLGTRTVDRQRGSVSQDLCKITWGPMNEWTRLGAAPRVQASSDSTAEDPATSNETEPPRRRVRKPANIQPVVITTRAHPAEEHSFLFDGTRSVSHPADSRLDLETQGTIELWFRATWEEDQASWFTLLACSSSTSTRYSLSVSPDKRALAYYNGVANEVLHADVSDGAWRHLALVTRPRVTGDRELEETNLFLDGRFIGAFPIGYGTASGLPLHIGSHDGFQNSYRGHIGGVRLWRKALTKPELDRVSTLHGPLPKADPLYWSLIGQSRMTGGSPDARFELLDEIFDPTGVWKELNTDTVRASNTDNEFTYKPITVYTARMEDASGPNAGAPRGGAPFFDSIPGDARIAEIHVHGGQWIDGVQFILELSNGSRQPLPLRGRVAGKPTVIHLDKGERLVSILGSWHQRQYKEKRITALQFKTSKKLSPVAGGWGGPGYVSFETIVPDKPSGIGGRMDSAGLYSLGFAEPRPCRLLHLIDDTEAVRDHVFVQNTANTYVSRSDGSQLILRREGFSWGNRKFERAKPRLGNRPGSEDTRYGYYSPFMTSGHLVNVDYSFRGYDLARLDPWDYKETGVQNRNFIFDHPGLGDTNYDITNSQVIPHGLGYDNQQKMGQIIKTTSCTTAEQYAKSMSRTIGGSIGVPNVASFSANHSFSTKTSEMYSKNQAYTHAEGNVYIHTLWMDKGNIKVSARFRNAVNDLLAKYLASDDRKLSQADFESSIILAFGTHYPHAITYGGRSVCELVVTEDTAQRMSESAEGVGVAADATVKKVQAGGSFSQSNSQSSGFTNSFGSQLSSWKAVGGSGGGKEMWMVDKNSVVPIFLDIRPIDELLKPPFFEAPEIIWGIREQLKTAVVHYMNSHPRPSNQEVLLQPKQYEVSVTKIKCVNSGEGTDDGEFFWELYCRYTGVDNDWQTLEKRIEDNHVSISPGKEKTLSNISRRYWVRERQRGQKFIFSGYVREADDGLNADDKLKPYPFNVEVTQPEVWRSKVPITKTIRLQEGPAKDDTKVDLHLQIREVRMPDWFTGK
ncbi:MAG: hypothetical protein H6834_08200 [Planctomycetes bacterium]|nr:hypothetical protein [Planctomycetota bacterium]